MIARYHGVAVDPAQIKHAFAIGNAGITITDIIRAAGELRFKAKAAKVTLDRLPKLPLPAIAQTRKNSYIILAKIDAHQVLILDPIDNKPKMLQPDELNLIWAGQLILLAYRGSKISEEYFDLKWFLPAIWKYRKPLSEVLIASLVLQIFGLVHTHLYPGHY